MHSPARSLISTCSSGVGLKKNERTVCMLSLGVLDDIKIGEAHAARVECTVTYVDRLEEGGAGGLPYTSQPAVLGSDDSR
jgi:hypothetical protein